MTGDMTFRSVFEELEKLAQIHGWDTSIRTGGPEGDTITNVWYEPAVPCIYVG